MENEIFLWHIHLSDNRSDERKRERENPTDSPDKNTSIDLFDGVIGVSNDPSNISDNWDNIHFLHIERSVRWARLSFRKGFDDCNAEDFSIERQSNNSTAHPMRELCPYRCVRLLIDSDLQQFLSDCFFGSPCFIEVNADAMTSLGSLINRRR